MSLWITTEFQLKGQRTLRNLEVNTRRAVPLLVGNANRVLYREMVKRAPRSKYTGEYGEPAQPGTRLAANIQYIAPTRGASGSYVGFVILPEVARYTIPPGTKKHPIPLVYKKGRKLVFYWREYFDDSDPNMEGGGAIVIREWVEHPGVRVSRDWTRGAMSAARKYTREELGKFVRAMRITTAELD